VFGFCYDASAVEDAVGGDEDILRMLEEIRTCQSIEFWYDAKSFREDLESALSARLDEGHLPLVLPVPSCMENPHSYSKL
jgi:hypothetical protein